MTKYIIAILSFVTVLALVLLYVGNDSMIVIQSTSDRPVLDTRQVEVSWQAAIVIMTLSIIGLIGLWSLVSWLWRLPMQVKSGVGRRRSNQALSAMEEALLAGAEGDSGKARRQSDKARQLINSPALGRMVSAQAAESAGDSEEAIANYQALLGDEKTRLAGQRGLAQQYLNTGDLSGAIEQAQSAFDSNKSARWATDTLYQAQIQDYRWLDAAKTLEEAQSRKQVSKDVARRRRAVLLTAEADRLENAGLEDDAIPLAQSAIDLSPDFVPASALLARILDKRGETGRAATIIEKAWSRNPHPALALAYRDIYADEPADVQRKKLRGLAKINPKSRESIILRAEEKILARDGVGALSDLNTLLQTEEPTSRIALLMAATEKVLNNPAEVALWTERAANAPVEPDWSDLDPAGDAFDYTDQDWRRLVYTYGETGEMIHPRFEQGAARRAVLPGASSEVVNVSPPPPPAMSAPDIVTRQSEDAEADYEIEPEPDSETDIGSETEAENKPSTISEIGSELSARFDNLLRRPPKK